MADLPEPEGLSGSLRLAPMLVLGEAVLAAAAAVFLGATAGAGGLPAVVVLLGLGATTALLARRLAALDDRARRRLVALEWVLLAVALGVGVTGSAPVLAAAVGAAGCILLLQFSAPVRTAFTIGFVGDRPPPGLTIFARQPDRERELPADAVLLSVEGLRTHFFTNDGTIKAVDGVSFSVRPGETVGLVGESGCGKSITSLSIMRLLSKPGRTVAGRIMFLGRNLLELPEDEMEDVRGAEIAMIFQEPMTALNPVLRVGDQIRDTLVRHLGISDRQARARVVELFEKVRIPSPKQRVQDYPHQLSGGMRQRVMIAMALACNPRLLIADEPTTALDVTIQAQILALLEDLKRTEKMGIVMITHDLGVIAEVADQVVVMYAGKVVETASVYDLFGTPKHPYTQGLLASMPSHERTGQRLSAIAGVVPHPLNLPPGCSFAPRCPHRFEPCDSAFPSLDEVAPAHRAACYLYTSGQDEVRADRMVIDPTSPQAEEVLG